MSEATPVTSTPESWDAWADCDRCLYDLHYCPICDDAVGHIHRHEEDE